MNAPLGPVGPHVALALGACLLLNPSPLDASIWFVWATTVNDFDSGVTSAGRQVQNDVWRDHRVQLATVAGGTVACQIVLDADEQGAREVSVRAPELWLKGGAVALGESRPTDGSGSDRGYGTRLSWLDGPPVGSDAARGQSAEAGRKLPYRGRLRLRLEVRVPPDQPPGAYQGGLVIDADRQRVLVPVDLLVRPFPQNTATR